MSEAGYLNDVKHALSIMYSSSAQVEKKQAIDFLESYQKSVQAWNTFAGLLNDLSLQVRLFGAQTLHSKIKYDLSQLPGDSYEQLKNTLLEFIVKPQNVSDKVIRTQLCLSLAQMALQYVTWNNAMDEVISKMSSFKDCIISLVDFLKVLPEELSDVTETSLTDEEFNARTKELITDNVDRVFLILQNLTDTNNNLQLNSIILDCLNSWIKEAPIEKILHINSLTNLIFLSLMNDETFDRSIECLSTIMRETRDVENHELIDALYQQLLKINEYMVSHKEKLEDPDIFSGLIRLYSESGESWHVLIAKNPRHFKPLVYILLECCKYEEDLDVVKYTFYFWYMLKQIIVLPKFEESRTEFEQIYLDLISVILKHLTYPKDQSDDDLFHGDKEQEDKFKEFRYEMGDVLKDSCAVAGAKKALNIPFQQIQRVLSSPPEQASWQDIESSLFSMRAMAKEVSLKEREILPTIMNYLVQLPEHPKVRYAATLVLGRFTEWSSKNPEFLETQLNYITKGFEVASMEKNKDIVIAASHALMYFCQDCATYLVEYLEQLYMLYNQIRGQIDIESTYELVDGIAHVVKQMPVENQYKTSEMFLAPTVASLENYLAAADPNDKKSNFDIADQVEVITKFLSVLRASDFEKPDYPVANYFIDKIWILARNILSKFGKAFEVSERVLKLIKSAIQSFSTYIESILPDTANLLHQGFRETNYGCYFWVSGALIREYGDEYTSGQTKQAVYDFGLTQSSLLFEFVSSNIDISQYPDVIEDFFRMASDLLMFFPFQLVVNLDYMKHAFATAITTLNVINEPDPLLACLHFLIDYISWGGSSPPISFFKETPLEVKSSVQQFLLIDDTGEKLFSTVLHGLTIKFPHDLQPDASDLLLKTLLLTPDVLVAIKWLTNSANSVPKVSSREVEKLVYTAQIALANKDNRRVRTALKDFITWYARKNVNPRSEF